MALLEHPVTGRLEEADGTSCIDHAAQLAHLFGASAEQLGLEPIEQYEAAIARRDEEAHLPETHESLEALMLEYRQAQLDRSAL